MKRSVIVSAKRTAMGRFMGSISKMPAPQLGAEVAKVVLGETKALDGGVDEVIVGQVLQAAVGQNPARQVALGAGLPDSINAWTVNKVCGSSLESVMQANRAIRCGDAKVVLAGGIESMSMAPFYVPSRARAGLKFGAVEMLDARILDMNLSRAEIGTRGKGLDVLGLRLDSEEIELREALSLEYDADIVEVISNLNARQLALQAAFMSAGEIFELTLLNYL